MHSTRKPDGALGLALRDACCRAAWPGSKRILSGGGWSLKRSGRQALIGICITVIGTLTALHESASADPILQDCRIPTLPTPTEDAHSLGRLHDHPPMLPTKTPGFNEPNAQLDVKDDEGGRRAIFTVDTANFDLNWETTGDDHLSKCHDRNWRDYLRIYQKTDVGGATHEIVSILLDIGRTSGYSPELYFLDPERWVRNKVADIQSVSSFLGGSVKITSRRARSIYHASQEFTTGRDTKKDLRQTGPGKERFLGLAEVEGGAETHRLDLKMFELGKLRASAFVFRSDVDWEFEALHLSRKDIFAEENRSTTGAGGGMALGPLAFDWVQSTIDAIVGVDVPTKQRQDAFATLDIAQLRQGVEGALGQPVSLLFPGSIWASWSKETTELRSSEAGLPDMARGYSLGGTWAWDNGSAGVSYWNESHDIRRKGLEDYDWVGDGLDAYISIWGSAWTASYSVSYQRSTSFQPTLRNQEEALDHNWSWSYKPEKRIGLFGIANLGFFEGDYGGALYESSYWSSTAGIDLSNWVRSSLKGRDGLGLLNDTTSLRLYYVMAGETERNWAADTSRMDVEHSVALVFKTRF